MSKRLRGSYYVDGRRSMTLPTTGDDKLVDVGFRLAHDASNRVDRGGCWDFAADSARAAVRLWNFPGGRGLNLGFRLVKEGA